MCIVRSSAYSGAVIGNSDEYLISGNWEYAGGSAHAAYFSLNSIIDNHDNLSSFIIPAEKGRLLIDFFYSYLGIHVVFKTSEFSRVWRDLKTGS